MILTQLEWGLTMQGGGLTLVEGGLTYQGLLVVWTAECERSQWGVIAIGELN